jgi:hypothetical protein
MDLKIGKRMTDWQRGKILEIADNNSNALPILHLIYRCSKSDHILSWLRSNKISGQGLVDWFRNEFNNSPYQMLKFFDDKFQTDNKNFIL